MNIIEVSNLTFSYKDKTILNNLNLNIKKNSWTTILGNNGSGKSTLIKLLLGMLEGHGEIFISNTRLSKNNRKELLKNFGVVFDNVNNTFITDIVEDEIVYPLENLDYDRDTIRSRLNDVVSLLKLEKILYKQIDTLTNSEKILVSIASSIIHEPKILIIDETLANLDYENKKIVFKALKKLQDNNLTIINVTHDIEDTIYSSDIAVIDDGKIILEGLKEEVLKKEKAFTKLGMRLPFLASLSLKLSYYDLTDDIILDKKKMVDHLWK